MPTDLNPRDDPSVRRRPVSSVLVVGCLSLSAAVCFVALVKFAPPSQFFWPAQFGPPYRIGPR